MVQMCPAPKQLADSHTSFIRRNPFWWRTKNYRATIWWRWRRTFFPTSPATRTQKKTPEQTTAAVALPWLKLDSISVRFWLRCDGSAWETEKWARLEIEMTDRRKTAEHDRRQRASFVSLQLRLRRQQEKKKSNYRSQPTTTAVSAATRKATHASHTPFPPPCHSHPRHLSIGSHFVLVEQVQMEPLDGTAQAEGGLWLAVRNWAADGAQPWFCHQELMRLRRRLLRFPSFPFSSPHPLISQPEPSGRHSCLTAKHQCRHPLSHCCTRDWRLFIPLPFFFFQLKYL